MVDLALATAVLGSLVTLLVVGTGCSSLRKGLGVDGADGANGKPISNPWGDSAWVERQSRDRVIFRTKKGPRSLEVELPAGQPEFADFMVPLSPEFGSADGGRGPASAGGSIDPSYDTRGPSVTDMEILHGMPAGDPTDDKERRDIEEGLGLKAVETDAPRSESSYLASVDKIKQLFRIGRYEAALLDTDQMLRLYPTDPRLYEMRGTLLDRLGHHNLAVRSWQQALKLDPNNQSLKIYIDQKSEKANWRKVSTE